MPWLPFLEKALRSDVFVFLDDVQFEKNSEQNRNRIKTATGSTWLTVPVSRQLATRIPDVCIPQEEKRWKRKHISSIEQNYRKASFFDEVAPAIFELLDSDWEKLLDLNLAVDRLFVEMVGFSGDVVRTSELSASGAKSDRVLSICKEIGATVYLSGRAGADYLDHQSFKNNHIEIRIQDYKYRPYPQAFPQVGFVPGLSALDLFFNVGSGPIARDQILKSGEWHRVAEDSGSGFDMPGKND